MATKAGILATINGFITSVITQAKHRSSMATVVDELYPTEVIDSQATETYTTKSGTDITYSLVLSKQGNQVAIKISNFRNTTAGALPSGNAIFTWKVTEFQPKTTVNDVIIQSFRGANRVGVLLNSTGLYLNDSMLPSSTTFSTQFTIYIAKV